MLGRLFENADQRRDRETKQEYDACLERYARRKRSFRLSAASNFTLSNPGCSFLMNDLSAGFLALDPLRYTIVSGEFIDADLIRPDSIGDHEPRAKRVAALEAYRKEARFSEFRQWKPQEGPMRNIDPRPRLDLVYEREKLGYTSSESPVEAITYVAVKRNDEIVLSINAFQPKPHLFFASYLPAALARFQTTASAMNSWLAIEVATSNSLYSYKQVYDDFHKLSGPGVNGFRSMLEMCVEFLTAAERMTHEAIGRLKFRDELDREMEIEHLCELVRELDIEALMRS